jgi:hypothetical protein
MRREQRKICPVEGHEQMIAALIRIHSTHRTPNRVLRLRDGASLPCDLCPVCTLADERSPAAHFMA